MAVTRQTKKVKLLLSFFDNENRAISVVDLVKVLESQMNKTTVYRILKKLMDDGVLHSFIGKDGLKWYAKQKKSSFENQNNLHPHFQCKICGEVKCLPISFSIPELEGYKTESASLLITGSCAKCS